MAAVAAEPRQSEAVVAVAAVLEVAAVGVAPSVEPAADQRRDVAACPAVDP